MWVALSGWIAWECQNPTSFVNPPRGPWAGAIYASYAQGNLSIYGKLFATFDTTSKILQNMHPKEITKMVYNVC